MRKRVKTLSAEAVVNTLNMLLQSDALALYRLANLRVACHSLKYSRPDLAYHISELDFPVMGALELINIILTENTDKAIRLRIDKRGQCYGFEVMDKADLKSGGAVLNVPEVL